MNEAGKKCEPAAAEVRINALGGQQGEGEKRTLEITKLSPVLVSSVIFPDCVLFSFLAFLMAHFSWNFIYFSHCYLLLCL